MHHFTISAAALNDKFRQSARNQGHDVAKAASRHVAERVLDAIETFVPPFLVKGGLLWPQAVRPTADADIVCVRRISNREMQRALKLAARDLAREGITLKSVSREPREISLEYGEPVDRWEIVADCGSIRANTHLDVGYANGLDSRPKGVTVREIPSIIKDGPAFRFHMQPLATAAAERLLAILMQPSSDLHVKYLADVTNGNLWNGLECSDVAEELARTCRYRGIPMSVLAAEPEALCWTSMSHRSAAWDKHHAAGLTPIKGLGNAWIDVNAIWTDVHTELQPMIRRDCRRLDYTPTLVDRLLAPKEPEWKYRMS